MREPASAGCGHNPANMKCDYCKHEERATWGDLARKGGETAIEYTDRLTGANGTNQRPYAERRLRQCSIGYHDECSDPEGIDCKCPCHQFDKLRNEALKLEAIAMSAEGQTND
jgi:hypothetical protein